MVHMVLVCTYKAHFNLSYVHKVLHDLFLVPPLHIDAMQGTR